MPRGGEVREVFPECVAEGKDGYLDFNMHAINVALVNAVQELHTRLQTEGRHTEDLAGQVAVLQSQLADFRQQMMAQRRDLEARYSELEGLLRDGREERDRLMTRVDP